MHFTVAQRRFLGLAALAGFIGPNGLLLYVAMAHRDVLAQALANPVAQAFIAEALMLTVLGCWLIKLNLVVRGAPIKHRASCSLPGSLD